MAGKILKANHELPNKFWLGYILLPFGNFYSKTKPFLDAKPGDILRFHNGPDVKIEKVMLIDCNEMCNYLCQMRYGIPWDKALEVWLRYARMEGNDADVLSKYKCLLVFYDAEYSV